MAKRRNKCAKLHCREATAIGGLCQKHHDENERKHHRYMEAADVLHTGSVDGEYIRQGPLRDELQKIQKWWRQVCGAVNAERQHPVLKDETESAMSWCIGIAQEIIDAERELRAGGVGDDEMRQYRRRQLWERFENLERGLMSNGVARLENRR